MNPSVTELLIQGFIAFGTIAVVIIAIWGDWFRARFAAPKLRIELIEPIGAFVPLSGSGKRTAFWVNAKVVNQRRWINPKNCRVLLRSLARRGPNNIFKQIPLTVPLQYMWAPSELSPPSVDIPHEHYFDFGSIVDSSTPLPQNFRPMLYSYTNNFRGFLQAGESIRYSLQIQADNFASDKYQVFEVAWDGEWNSDFFRMREHLKVKEIKNS